MADMMRQSYIALYCAKVSRLVNSSVCLIIAALIEVFSFLRI